MDKECYQLLILQKKALRMITKSHYCAHTELLYNNQINIIILYITTICNIILSHFIILERG